MCDGLIILLEQVPANWKHSQTVNLEEEALVLYQISVACFFFFLTSILEYNCVSMVC